MNPAVRNALITMGRARHSMAGLLSGVVRCMLVGAPRDLDSGVLSVTSALAPVRRLPSDHPPKYGWFSARGCK